MRYDQIHFRPASVSKETKEVRGGGSSAPPENTCDHSRPSLLAFLSIIDIVCHTYLATCGEMTIGQASTYPDLSCFHELLLRLPFFKVSFAVRENSDVKIFIKSVNIV